MQAPFGVDLLLPQVGGSARKTNYDYTDGKLPELIDIVVESGAALFVSAVGVPPIWAVEKLHAAGIPVRDLFVGVVQDFGERLVWVVVYRPGIDTGKKQ